MKPIHFIRMLPLVALLALALGPALSPSPALAWQVHGCTVTQGFYKNHPSALPDTMTLGGTTLTRDQLVSILETPVAGNGAIALLHQLIAAEANRAGGASSTAAVNAALNQANALLSGVITVSGTGTVTVGNLSPSQTSGLTNTLDQYNEGMAAGGPPHCKG
jgi:hypothetical protein